MFGNPRYWLCLHGTQQIDTRFVSFVTPIVTRGARPPGRGPAQKRRPVGAWAKEGESRVSPALRSGHEDLDGRRRGRSAHRQSGVALAHLCDAHRRRSGRDRRPAQQNLNYPRSVDRRLSRTHQLGVTSVGIVVAVAVAGVSHVQGQLRDTGDVGGQMLSRLPASHHSRRSHLITVGKHAERDTALSGGRVVNPDIPGERRAARGHIDDHAANRVGAEPLGIAALAVRRAARRRARGVSGGAARWVVRSGRPPLVRPRHRRGRGRCLALARDGPAPRPTRAAAIYPAGLELVRVGIHWVGSAAGMSGYSGTTLSARVSAGRPDTSGPMSFMASSMRTEEAI
jgi:hypothetical protein